MYQAFLLDLDGTIADTDPLHLLAFAAFLEPAGYQVDEAFFRARIHGRTVAETFANLMPGEDSHRLDQAKEAKFRDLLAQNEVIMTAGLVGLIDAADAARIPCAVATNGCYANAVAVLARLGLSERFVAVISAEHCARGKPAPDPYLKAAEAARADPNRCLAFEDSASGIAAARAAGCTVVGLTTALTGEELLAAGAHHAIRDFADPALAELVGGASA